MIEPTRGSSQLAQEKPDPPPQPAVGGGLIEADAPPTLMLEADITFFTSEPWHDSQETELVSVDETMASNSLPQELQTNS